MKVYATAFLIAGIIIPTFLHMFAGETMPWWPDTVSLGVGFGAGAVAVVWKARTDREMNRRLWKALQALVRR